METATATGGDRRSAGANTGPGGRAGAAAGERDEQEGELCTRERYDIAVFESCMPDYMGSSGYCVLASSTQMKRPGSSESGSICNNGLSYRCTYPFLSWALLFPKDEMCTIQLGKAVRMCKVQWFGGPGALCSTHPLSDFTFSLLPFSPHLKSPLALRVSLISSTSHLVKYHMDHFSIIFIVCCLHLLPKCKHHEGRVLCSVH